MKSWQDFEEQAQWWEDNVVTADPDDIVTSAHIHCGVPMEEYIGKEFVNWTHRCTICKVQYGAE